jgi:hypothetical protein
MVSTTFAPIADATIIAQAVELIRCHELSASGRVTLKPHPTKEPNVIDRVHQKLP